MAKQKNQQMGKNGKPRKESKPIKSKSKLKQRIGKIGQAVKKAAKAVIPTAAGFLGDYLGGPIAGSLFSTAAAKLTGSGDYHIKSTGAAAHEIPAFGNIQDTGINIKNREFIGTVSSSTGLNQWKIGINPGLPDTFPFLSRIASNFEKYRFRGLVFYFKSTAASAFASTTNIAMGQVIITSVPDPAEAQPTTLEAVLNRKDNTVAKPSEDCLHGWECKRGMQVLNEYYIRTSNTGDDQDIRFTDPGYLLLSTNGNPAANMEIGQLWVSYDVDLMVPKLSVSGDGYLIRTDRFINFSGVATATPLGTQAGNKDAAEGSTLGCVVSGGTNTLIFPPALDTGTFLVTLSYRSSTGTIESPLISSLNNCTGVTNAFQHTPSVFAYIMATPSTPAVSENESVLMIVVKVTAKNATIVFDTSGDFGAGVQCTVLVTEVNPSAFESVTLDEVELIKLLKKLGLKKKALTTIREIASDKDSMWSFE